MTRVLQPERDPFEAIARLEARVRTLETARQPTFVADILATDAPGGQSAAGSGTGWSVIQTIPSSGTNFTLPRVADLMVVSTLNVVLTAGAQNYCALYHSVWKNGVLVSRKRIPAIGFTLNLSYFVTGISFFKRLAPSDAANDYQIRQEFALDVATTGVNFGIGATGMPPVAEVLQLGS